MGFIDAFWKAAASLDPAAAESDEADRFPFCSPEGPEKPIIAAGIDDAELIGLEVPTVFRDMEYFWQLFTPGAGPAPGYCLPRFRDRRGDCRCLNHNAGGRSSREQATGPPIGSVARVWRDKMF